MTTIVSPVATYPVSSEANATGDIQRIKLITGAAGIDGGVVTTTNPFPVTAVFSPTSSALTPAAPATATAGVASGAMVAANASRRGLSIHNTSANRVFLAFGANAAALNRGIFLAPGGSWTMGQEDFTTLAVNAIAAAAGSTLSVQEWT